MPAALKFAWQGATWPVQVVAELKANTLTEKAENITVSPRWVGWGGGVGAWAALVRWCWVL